MYWQLLAGAAAAAAATAAVVNNDAELWYIVNSVGTVMVLVQLCAIISTASCAVVLVDVSCLSNEWLILVLCRHWQLKRLVVRPPTRRKIPEIEACL